MIDFRLLAKSGVHFGHQSSRWNPKMSPYIWGHKNGVHIIDVSKTAYQLEKAAKFLESVAADKKSILWVGTKKPAQNIILSAATELKMPYVNHRWIGGTLSNFGQVKKSVTRLLHFEDILARSEKFPHYTKKELNTIQKVVNRLEKNVGGIRKLAWPVGAVVLIDVRKEQSALKEAARMGVPVVALVDTNNDPSMVDYVIPGNDDAPRAIKVIVDYLVQAVEKGASVAATREDEKQQAQAAKEVAGIQEGEPLIPELMEDDAEELEIARQKKAKKAAGRPRLVEEEEVIEFDEKKEKKPIKDMSRSKAAASKISKE